MITDIAVPFITIALAELGDKTQLSVLLLSSKTKKHFELLLGVMLAFFMVDGVAILAGSWVTGVLPMSTLKLASGAIFVFFGILILKDHEKKDDKKRYSKNPFLSGFVLVFMAEWGDKTQIAAAIFATEYDAWMVLAGTLLALALLSAMAVYFGKFISKRISNRVITKIAGIVFLLLGLSFLLV